VFCNRFCSVGLFFVDVDATLDFTGQCFGQPSYLDPENSEYPYFALRECPVEMVEREAYWVEPGESVKDLQILTITFTAVGVTTLFPHVLYVQPGGDQIRYRLNGRLFKSCVSSDGRLLYSIATDNFYKVF
jgi:hypothetical protein